MGFELASLSYPVYLNMENWSFLEDLKTVMIFLGSQILLLKDGGCQRGARNRLLKEILLSLMELVYVWRVAKGVTTYSTCTFFHRCN